MRCASDEIRESVSRGFPIFTWLIDVKIYGMFPDG